MTIKGRTAIQTAYCDEQVASAYIDERFSEPLGALLHARQAGALARTIRRLRPAAVLEIAPGPARVTVDVAPLLERGGTVLDSSPQMLAEARRRLEPVAAGRWKYMRGDAFQLPFLSPFDLVYTFRLIRHFERADRIRLYRQIARVLRPGAVLMFDAVNEAVSRPLRARATAGEYQHYDGLVRPDSLRAELADGGLELTSLEGLQHHYPLLSALQVYVAPRSRTVARAAMEIVDRIGGEPLEWIVTCRRA
jgi:ubiquinone/menaquinone biosynthesis C-methylase UbiE